METLADIALQKTRDRAIRVLEDAINKLSAFKNLITLGFPESPREEALARGFVDKRLYRRDEANSEWIQVVDTENIQDVVDTYVTLNSTFQVLIVTSLPAIPPQVDGQDVTAFCWFEGQLWGTSSAESRWYPTMRFTMNTGEP